MKSLGVFFSLIATSVLVAAVLAAESKSPAGVDEYDLELRVNRKDPPASELLPLQPAATATIRVDPQRVTAELNPLFIGYNIEDLSHAFFPGLYAQMLYGESFEDEPDVALPAGWQAHLEPLTHEMLPDPAVQRKWRGAWAFENGVVTLTGCRQRRLCTRQVELTDGNVECELLQPAFERNYWGPGLLVCWKPSAYYYVYLAPERSVVVLCKGDNPLFTQSAKTLAYRNQPLAYDRWYKLKVCVQDGLIRVFLDGQEVLSHRDPQPLSGGVGLESSFTVGRFRNLSVTPAGGAAWRADFAFADRPYLHRDHISRWWDPIVSDSAQARFQWERENPYNTDRCQLVEFVSGTGAVGLHNTGLHNWGLTVREGWSYRGRLYLRGAYDGEVTLALQSRDGSRTYATQKLRGVEKDWKRFDIQLAANATDTNARFALWIDRPGRIFVDQAVLLPGDEGLYKGLPLRRDLAEKMVAGIRHIRFGGDMINVWAFDWKQMRAPQDRRRQYLDGWNYHKSAQFMIFEFLDFCRAAGVEPLVNFGEHTLPQDIAEFVEYCNGDAATAWGRQRIADGRREAYGVKYLMYGNGLPSPENLRRAADLIRVSDPRVPLIVGDVGHETWTNIVRRDPKQAAAVDALADRLEALGSRPEVGDLGSYLNWEENIRLAQSGFPAFAKRERPFFYAEEVNSGHHNWQRGLSDALFVITGEKHGRTVWANSFCTALQASGHLYEWDEGHIHFNSADSWYQPSGWVVRLLGENHLPLVLHSEVEAPATELARRTEQGLATTRTPALVASAARSRDGRSLIVKAVNLWGGPVATRLQLGQELKVESLAVTTMSSRHLKAVNTAQVPHGLVPQTSVIPDASAEMTYTFPPASLTILKFRLAAGPQDRPPAAGS